MGSLVKSKDAHFQTVRQLVLMFLATDELKEVKPATPTNSPPAPLSSSLKTREEERGMDCFS
jgi:hypothetical protein